MFIFKGYFSKGVINAGGNNCRFRTMIWYDNVR